MNLRNKHDNWKASPLTIGATSIISVIIILFVSYLMNNNPYPMFDDIDHYSKLEYINRKIHKDVTQDSDVLYINVCYDKKLIPYNDPENGFPQGNIDITNREKLSHFLKIAQQANNYKYIFMDVRFEKGYEDEDTSTVDSSLTVDQQLVKDIKATPRLVISNHKDITLLDTTLLSKSAISDFTATITATNFVRYQYLYNGQESVPLKMYKDLFHQEITKSGLLYLCNNKLCQNCPFLQIHVPFTGQYDTEGNSLFYNLGADLLDANMDEDLKVLMKDKYVIIGNFIDDIHDTYVGMQPGSYINYLAFKALQDGSHLVNWTSASVLGILYMLICIFMFSKTSVISHIPFLRKYESKFIRFFISFLGISFAMQVVTDVTYLIDGETFCMWFPSLYFTIMSTIISYKES